MMDTNKTNKKVIPELTKRMWLFQSPYAQFKGRKCVKKVSNYSGSNESLQNQNSCPTKQNNLHSSN